jgi:uncharacterized protein YqhQ
MAENQKVRLGGMALANGVLVHGPTAWACAVRTEAGEMRIASERKRVLGSGVNQPLLRGPARLVESIAVLPRVKRLLPEARLPFEGRKTVAATIGTAVAMRLVRRSRLGETTQEIAAGLLAVTPALLSVRSGSLAAYHGAEHIAIGSYEQDAPSAKEHDRCGSHLVGPLILMGIAGNVLAARAPRELRPAARLAASMGALAAATEIFGWMTRHPDRLLARALARPGHELQHRLSTAEPSADQLAVAEAALAACLELEA